MKNITLTEFNDSFVKFESNIGNGIAVWSGDWPPPKFCHDIELNIDVLFQWGTNISRANEENSSVKTVGNKIVFTAKILSCEDDGMLTISLDGSVMFIEVSKNSIIDGYVSFFTTPDNIKIYPVKL